MKRIIAVGSALAALAALPSPAVAVKPEAPCFESMDRALNAPERGQRPQRVDIMLFLKRFQCLFGQPPNAGPGHP